MENRKVLREKESHRNVYVNEDLTRLLARILNTVKRRDRVRNVHTRDGKIICNMVDNTGPIYIESPDDLYKIGFEHIDYAEFGLQQYVST